ncbi:hypothetical protein FRUB_01347 [Fimbriiglobus ruber]|uniref:Uncharacterized protein n=2 Tax=Fimbriiglobus ruber TaxID=1908690 RepID=A0A225E4L1_9BACT|nr:hypothetical protein FRUB_01347 [Fimbriiglobus ruber]
MFIERAVPLLKEYLNKVTGVQKQIRDLRNEYEQSNGVYGADTNAIYKAEFDSLQQYFNRLNPALDFFSQQVSGMIEQGQVDPLTRVELQMRLAELESALLQIPYLLQAYRIR